MIAGTTLSAWTTAFTKNDMKPSLTSCFLTKRSWNFVAQRDDVGEIDLVEGGEVRGFLLRGEQARGDFLAQRATSSCATCARRRFERMADCGRAPDGELPLSGSGEQDIALE